MVNNRDKATWLLITMDEFAENEIGEFGYDTCNRDQKIMVLKAMLENGMFKELED